MSKGKVEVALLFGLDLAGWYHEHTPPLKEREAVDAVEAL